MNPEIRTQWLADLRSGEFKQERHRLTTVLEDGTEQDCCLGVLCKQAVKAGIAEKVVRETAQGKQVFYRAVYDPLGFDDATLPYAVRNWAELLHPNPVVVFDGGTMSLGELNDEAGKSFPEIADVIEQYL